MERNFKLDNFWARIYPKPISIGKVNKLCYECKIYDIKNVGENQEALISFYIPISVILKGEPILKKLKSYLGNILKIIGER